MLATRRREMLRLPDLPLVFLPHPMMIRTADEIASIADDVVATVARTFTHSASGGTDEE